MKAAEYFVKRNFLIIMFMYRKVSEYDLEISQSNTTDQPTAVWPPILFNIFFSFNKTDTNSWFVCRILYNKFNRFFVKRYIQWATLVTHHL